MRKTLSKMHLHDIVKIDNIVFEIVAGGGGGQLKPHPPPPDASFDKLKKSAKTACLQR